MPSPTPDDLSPEEERVRRLLADARHTEPMPEEVAARLDGVVADLRREGAVSSTPSVPPVRTTVDVAVARRRRRARSWLVAAVAVVVVGVGLDQLARLDLGGVGGGSGDSSSADSGSGGRTAREEHLTARRPGRLDSDRFGAQVTRLQRTRTTSATPDGSALSAEKDRNHEKTRNPVEGFACSSSGWGRGRMVPVRYDGQPAVLVFRRVRGDTQVVDLFPCGQADPIRSITLPAP